MGGELTEGVGEQKPTLHDQNTTSNPALKTTSTQAFQEISSPFRGKIRFHGANERAGFPDSRAYFGFSLSQKLTRSFGF